MMWKPCFLSGILCVVIATHTDAMLFGKRTESNIVKFGSPVIEKGQHVLPPLKSFTGENGLWRIDVAGVITAWKFYTKSPIETAFQVWRIVESKSKYQLIGQNVITTGTDQKQRYDVPAAEQISVQPGDLTGIVSAGLGGVVFSRCDPVDNPTWPGTSYTRTVSSLSDFQVNAVVDMQTGAGCALIQYQAEISTK